MPYNLFGFLFKSSSKPKNPSFAPVQNDDGATVVDHGVGGAYSSVVDLDGVVKSEIELVTRYRDMSQRPEVDGAIREIVNEAIVNETAKSPVSIVTDKLSFSDDIKQKIQDEFATILNLLDFNNEGQDLFRQWYIDGRLYIHIIIDENDPRKGIQELRLIDPRLIRPVIEMESYVNDKGITLKREVQRYYMYNQYGDMSPTSISGGIPIAWDAICHIHSGIRETNNTMILSHLHKALKPSNLLTMCFPGDTLVSVPDGQKRIADLKVGDPIWCHDGNSLVESTVKRQWSSGVRPTVRVKTVHHDFVCTPDHPIYARRDRRVRPEWIPAGELTDKDAIVFRTMPEYGDDILIPDCSRKGIHVVTPARAKGKYRRAKEIAQAVGRSESVMLSFFNGHCSLPVTEGNLAVSLYDWPIETASCDKSKARSLDLPQTVTPEFARLFGFLLGDGYVGPSVVSFAEGTHADINDRYKGLMDKFFGACNRNNSKKRKYTAYSCTSVVAAETMRSLGFIGDSHTKRFPEWIFRAKPEIRRAMVEGFLDADGSKRKSTTDIEHYRINLCNRGLLEDIKRAWTSLGLCSGQIYQCARKYTKSTLKGFDKDKVWISYKLEISTLPLPNVDRVKSVIPDQVQEVFDIDIHHKAHNFFINSGLQVHNCEDASVIYRLSRAPERRIFYIDVGSLPPNKAEQFVKGVMSKYRNKMVFDASTGEIKDDKKFLSFMEDYWLPRADGSRGTQIDTLPGGENLGEMADVEYFKEKLYQSLNVPVGRLKSDSGFTIGRAAEITRDETKFGQFITTIRNRFSTMFDILLSTQLMLKGIINRDDWNSMRQKIFYDYLKESYFTEMKDLEVLRERLAMVEQLMTIVGKYIPHEYIRRVILKQTDEEYRQFDEQMSKEKNDPRYQAIEMMTGMGPMGPGMGMGGDPSMAGGAAGMPGMMPAGPQDPSMMYGQPQGGPVEGMPQDPSQQENPEDEQYLPQQQQQYAVAPDEEEEEDQIDPDNLPAERITKNLESLWKR